MAEIKTSEIPEKTTRVGTDRAVIYDTSGTTTKTISWDNLFAGIGEIGGTTPAAGIFTTIIGTGDVDFESGTIDQTVIGGSTAASATFTGITGTSLNLTSGASIDQGWFTSGVSSTNIDSTVFGGVTPGQAYFNAIDAPLDGIIGSTTPAIGAFTGISGTSLNIDSGATLQGGVTITGGVSVGTGNVEVQAGHIFGQVPLLTSATTITLTSDQVLGHYLTMTAAGGVSLPAVTGANGWSILIRTADAFTVYVDPNENDKTVLDGITLDNGDRAQSSGVTGDTLLMINDSVDGWSGWSGPNDWIDGG